MRKEDLFGICSAAAAAIAAAVGTVGTAVEDLAAAGAEGRAEAAAAAAAAAGSLKGRHLLAVLWSWCLALARWVAQALRLILCFVTSQRESLDG
jgi:hypothetical protein